MLSFGDYSQYPTTQLNWTPYPINFGMNNDFNMPALFNFWDPGFNSYNYNIFPYTPPVNFGFTPPIIHTPGANPFAFLEQTTNTNPNTNIFRPFPLDDPIPYQTAYESNSNPFGFLNQQYIMNHNYSTTPGNSTIKTRRVGGRVAQEVLPGKEVLTIGRGIKLDSLKQDLKVKLVQLSEKASSMGYTLVVSDAFRTHQQQIDAKRRKPTLAATPGKSPHEYGAGIDIALYDKNGKQVNIATVKGFGEYAKSIGLEWGNDWKSKKEPWHFQLANWRSRSDIAAEYRRMNNTVA